MNCVPTRKDIFRGVVNFASTVLTCYLIYVQIDLYLSKPTYTDKYREKIDPRNIPDVYLCSIPSTDSSQLTKHGYGTSYDYVIGKMENTKLRGWGGNSSIYIENVTEDISTFKTVKDCPYLHARFEDDEYGRYKIVLNFTLTRFIHPHGRCCQAIIPTDSQKYSLIQFFTRIHGKSSINGFQLYLSGKKASHIYKLNNFQTNGMSFITLAKDFGIQKWKIKVLEEFQLEDDQKVSCKNYVEERGYSKCLDDLLLSQYLRLFNCSPPFITDLKQFWCTENWIYSKIDKKADYFLWQFANQCLNQRQCLRPCNFVRYKAEKVGISKRRHQYGISLLFEKEVEITTSQFKIDALNLLTKIGGIFGVGRTLVWIIDNCFYYISYTKNICLDSLKQ